MKMKTPAYLTFTVVSTLLAGCAGDSTGGLFSTASVAPAQVAEAPKTDPACASLISQIDALRKEGTVERLEKVASGNGKTVPVQRAALAKQSELNKANADYIAKCSPTRSASTGQQSAALTVTTPVATPASGVTVVTPKVKATP
jgi:hypothetical protein